MGNTGDTIRIAGVQGFYGDSPAGAIAVARQGAADYLVHDALSELTLSILHKDRQRDPNLGYARDIELFARMLYPICLKKGMRVVTNSGGLNPVAAGQKVAALLEKQGISGAKIAVITGDDMIDRLDELQAGGEALHNMDTGEAYADTPYAATHANVYVGAKSVVEALEKGADIILAGRVADPCLALGILVHHFGWKMDGDMQQADWDRLAAGITVGHVLECGGQASGGNAWSEWPYEYPVHNLGYPIAEVSAGGQAVFTKAAGTGGKVSRNTVREQLVYEIHDPAAYLTPDVTVDLTQINLEEIGPDRVQLSGVKGAPRPEKLKMTVGQARGFLSDQLFFFSWPDAYGKVKGFEQAVRDSWAAQGLKPVRMYFSVIGLDGIHGAAAPLPSPEALANVNELGLRVAVAADDPKLGPRCIRGAIGLALNGPPGLVSVPGWGKTNRGLLGLWPALVERKWLNMQVEMSETRVKEVEE